ncbi:MAG: hypothetical protein QM715_20210 [Nibricoccus sp.]
MESRYVLRGMVLAVPAPAAEPEEFVDLVAMLDDDAAQTAFEELAKVRRLYALEVRKRGREMIWLTEGEQLLAPKIESKQLLFTLPGVEVYELQHNALAW